MVTIPHAYDKWQRTGLLVAMIGIATTGGGMAMLPSGTQTGQWTIHHRYPSLSIYIDVPL